MSCLKCWLCLYAFIQSAHGKEYAPGEESVRKAKFLAVDALIQANNQDPNSTFVMAHNKLSDLVNWFACLIFHVFVFDSSNNS